MNTAKEDLLLHPVRARILVAVGARRVTAQQLADELPDIPQATLYRNINLLAAGGVLAVVGERPIHNTVEKTYALAGAGSFLGPEDLKDAQPEDYMRLYTRYLGTLLGYFTRYIQRGHADLAHDNVLFQITPLYLSEAETQSLGQAITAAVLPYIHNAPSPERRRSLLGLTFFPDVTTATAPAGARAAAPGAEASAGSEGKEGVQKHEG